MAALNRGDGVVARKIGIAPGIDAGLEEVESGFQRCLGPLLLVGLLCAQVQPSTRQGTRDIGREVRIIHLFSQIPAIGRPGA